MDSITFENFGHATKRVGIQIFWFAVGLLFVLWAVDLMRKALAWVTDLHWSLGLIAVVLVLAGLVWLLSIIKNASLTQKSFGRYPKLGLALNLLLVLVGATVAMAFCSAILQDLGVASYDSKDPVTVPRLMDYYSYHFLDSLPVFAISDLLDVESRIEADDMGARVLLELFKVLIVVTVIKIFMTKRGNFRTQLAHAQAYRITGATDKAELTMDVAIELASNSDNPVDLADANIELARILAGSSPARAKRCLDEAEGCITRAQRATDLEARRVEIAGLRDEVIDEEARE